MNTAAVLPCEERCVCKCHGSESVFTCDTFTSILHYFQLLQKWFTSPPRQNFWLDLFFWFLCLSCCSAAEGGRERGQKEGWKGGCLTWNDVMHGGVWPGRGSDALAGADGVQWRLVGGGADSSAGSGVTGSLSNGGSGGSTGSSAGMMTSIPWCSGAERNLGHCFGNQGGGRSADE